MTKLKSIFYVTSVILLAACKSTPNPWTGDITIEKPVKIIAFYQDDRLSVEVPNKTSRDANLHFGPLGSSLAESIGSYTSEKKAEKLQRSIEKVNSSFSEIGFQSMMTDSLDSAFKTASKPFNTSNFFSIRNIKEIENIVGDEDTYILLIPSYKIAEDLSYTFVYIETHVIKTNGSRETLLNRTNIISIAEKLKGRNKNDEGSTKASLSELASIDRESIVVSFKDASLESAEILVKYLARKNTVTSPEYLSSIYP